MTVWLPIIFILWQGILTCTSFASLHDVATSWCVARHDMPSASWRNASELRAGPPGPRRRSTPGAASRKMNSRHDPPGTVGRRCRNAATQWMRSSQASRFPSPPCGRRVLLSGLRAARADCSVGVRGPLVGSVMHENGNGSQPGRKVVWDV